MTDGKLKMPAVLIFEIKRHQKVQNFQFLKGHFSVMRGPMDMIFGVLSKTYVRLLKSIISQFLSKYKKVITEPNRTL